MLPVFVRFDMFRFSLNIDCAAIVENLKEVGSALATRLECAIVPVELN